MELLDIVFGCGVLLVLIEELEHLCDLLSSPSPLLSDLGLMLVFLIGDLTSQLLNEAVTDILQRVNLIHELPSIDEGTS